MFDFSKMLTEMVEHQRGPIMEAGKKAVAPAAAKSLPEMIKMLKLLAKTVDEQVKIMDGELQTLLQAVKTKLGGDVKQQFQGLRHLTDEQKAHIEEVTTEANNRLKELKKKLEPLTKIKGDKGVQGLIDRVAELEGQLQQKQAEMDSQKLDYEELLDYYEDIMINMKQAEMEAKRKLRNAEAEMATSFDHAEAKGETLTEEAKKPRKKKKKRPASYRHYGTFDLNEHLSKAREKLPKSAHDW